jgi:hypothetical protein
MLQPEQKALIERWTREVGNIVGTRPDPQTSYDQLPLSSRTTFEAVTHALLRTKLTDSKGRSLGRAIDLVDIVERIAGRVDGVRGDHQFRVYVYLKRGAVDKLYAAREFVREKDNTVFHIGYPINFRQQHGPPSIQFSVARTGQRADIDVDYRSSAALKALFNGHLTASNSDVRAGGNIDRHNERWQDLGNWWQSLLASLFGNDLARADVSTNLDDGGPIVPAVNAPWEHAAKGDVQGAVRAYLEQWLVAREPANILRAVSVKAYPCVAEYRDGSRPDSKLALYRILAQMNRVNKDGRKVADLSAAIEPVHYPLPGAREIAHPNGHLFSLQLVPDDVAWALDCRLRYRLEMAEAVPRPPHALTGIYVTAWRFKKRADPNEFRVQFWQKQSGEWKLVSFDIKHGLEPPPPDIVERVAKGTGSPPGPRVGPALNATSVEQIEAAAAHLLTVWLQEKNAEAAIESFSPAAYACDGFEETPVAPDARSGEKGRARLLAGLTAIAGEIGRGDRLESVIAAPEAGHAHLEPIPHARSGAFLLSRVSDDLHGMHKCSEVSEATRVQRTVAAGSPTYSQEYFMTAFQAAQVDGDNPARVLLFWEKSGDVWRVVSYEVATD